MSNDSPLNEKKEKYGWVIGGALLIFLLQGNFDLVKSNNESAIATSEQAKFIFEELKEIKQELKESTKDRWSKTDHTHYARQTRNELILLENRMNDQTRDLKIEIQEIKDLIRGKIK